MWHSTHANVAWAKQTKQWWIGAGPTRLARIRRGAGYISKKGWIAVTGSGFRGFMPPKLLVIVDDCR
jgi:hypothetical protein